MNFDVHNIRAHDHDFVIAETRAHDDLGGRVVVQECRHPACDGRHIEWEDEPEQTTLGDIGGGADG